LENGYWKTGQYVIDGGASIIQPLRPVILRLFPVNCRIVPKHPTTRGVRHVVAGFAHSGNIVRENVARLADLMRADDFVAVIVFHPANMLAFAGTPHASSDRLTCAAVTRDCRVHLLCPAFERPAVAGAETIATIHTWEEHENPYDSFARVLREFGIRTGKIGLDGRVWLAAWQAFAAALKNHQLDCAEPLLRETRIIKSPAAQELLRTAHLHGEQLFLALSDLIQPGVSEIELYRQLQARFAADGLFVDPMIQSGRMAVPHNPTGKRRLQDGDTMVVDSVIVHDGSTTT